MKSFLLLSLFFLSLMYSNDLHATDDIASNLYPMFGNKMFSESQKIANREMFRKVEETGHSRQDASVYAIRKAWQFFRQQNLEMAMKRFNQAWLLDPENGDVYGGFAVLNAASLGPLETTEGFFKLAFAKENISSVSYVNYGWFLLNQKRFDEAQDILVEALAKNTRALNARSHMSFMFYLQKNYAKACAWAQDAKRNGDRLEKGFLKDMCKS